MLAMISVFRLAIMKKRVWLPVDDIIQPINMKSIITQKAWLLISIFLWISFFSFLGFVYYVNHYMPHGEIIDLTEYGCEQFKSGTLASGIEQEDCYQENMDGLQIPNWAKYIRSSWFLYALALLLISSITSSKLNKDNMLI